MSNSSLPLADVLGHEATDKRIDILRRIGEVGSISEAARGAGVSYKAAWQALETLTNLAGVPLVEKVVGGTGGGGAALTPAGQRVLQAAHALAAARQQVLSRLHSDDDAATGRAALALRTSSTPSAAFPRSMSNDPRFSWLITVAGWFSPSTATRPVAERRNAASASSAWPSLFSTTPSWFHAYRVCGWRGPKVRSWRSVASRATSSAAG